MKYFKFIFIGLLLLVIFLESNEKGTKIIIPDLAKIAKEDGWKLSNREIIINKKTKTTEVYFKGKPGNGCAWLEDLEMNNGIIECDIKGTTIRGRSFVGIAFRGKDEETYDVVYFRPFNFKASDPIRQSHSVQYVSHPEYTWSKLRKEFEGKFENRLDPIPPPEKFFNVKIIIDNMTVKAYINGAKKPCLAVSLLHSRKGGKIGLWTGNNSDGYFKNLKIVKKN